MNMLNCQEVRNQLMYFMDNELSDENRKPLLKHLKDCSSCVDYFNQEKEIKEKICNKLKDAYICRCNIEKLASSIKQKINEICYKDNDQAKK